MTETTDAFERELVRGIGRAARHETDAAEALAAMAGQAEALAVGAARMRQGGSLGERPDPAPVARAEAGAFASDPELIAAYRAGFVSEWARAARLIERHRPGRGRAADALRATAAAAYLLARRTFAAAEALGGEQND